MLSGRVVLGGFLLFVILLLGGAGPVLAGTGAALGADMGADMGAGIAAYKRADYGAARAAWGPLASNGDAQAQYYLGHLYAKGEGVDKDPVQALHWFRAAAEQGESYGQFALGYVYEHGLGGPPEPVAVFTNIFQ